MNRNRKCPTHALAHSPLSLAVGQCEHKLYHRALSSVVRVRWGASDGRDDASSRGDVAAAAITTQRENVTYDGAITLLFCSVHSGVCVSLNVMLVYLTPSLLSLSDSPPSQSDHDGRTAALSQPSHSRHRRGSPNAIIMLHPSSMLHTCVSFDV